MSKAVNAIVALIICFFPAALAAQEKYIASYAGFAGFQAPLWAAKDFGFLAKVGVNADLVMIPGPAREPRLYSAVASTLARSTVPH